MTAHQYLVMLNLWGAMSGAMLLSMPLWPLGLLPPSLMHQLLLP